MSWRERFGHWYQQLSTRLVLSHVFVAVLVLAFALGVSQVTFRQYLVRSQMARLVSQADAIAPVMHGYFTGAIYPEMGVYLVNLLQGTLNDRVFVVDDTGQVLLETGSPRIPVTPLPEPVLARVLESGLPYRGILNQHVAAVGVPIVVGNQVAGGVFLESPLSLANRTAGSLTRLLVLGEMVAVVVVGALAYEISQRLAQPIDRLRRTVATMGQGPESVRAEVQGPTEVQALAVEFNRLQDRIERQMEQLRREAEARDALLAHVAHDLRTPLTSIRGFLEAIEDGVATGEQQKRAIHVAWEETLRLQRLVDRLLKATRIWSQTGSRERLALQAWVGKTIERVRPVADRAQVGVVWQNRQDGVMWGNEDYLMEALMNVLDNAIKWSPPGSTVEVISDVVDGQAVIEVDDQGPGIPDELLPRVFERFVTGDLSRQGSSGLGLAIVEDVVRQHQGSVVIERRPEGGTRVTLRFPVEEASLA
ncbi:sensor histidine kinase [Sulfobacillus acidophilus TPY]|uniref:histidine kinase n=2 Tax=Sulfobacillus acidophilus TaxID=53633 RepID=G8TZ55_SULAD|nr:sensor histidine kinase [Sulfobacillus acidophilus DSM 10332]AEJ38971.1 sensor histidine kinase [Sulfobacillus acidophilus TPY]AEW06325.1 integral membrane sensor signal transduction histidine kinase [Sulfobacillus acidophilus DSM 10332]